MAFEIDDIVVLRKSGSKAKVVRVNAGGCGLIFLDDLAYAEKHGIPASGAEVWFPNDEFDKEV